MKIQIILFEIQKYVLPKSVHTPLPAKYMYLLSISHFDNPPPPANPISSLDPVILVEGQSYRQAASCRSVARPPPRLTWDTDLNGQSVNRSSDNGAVSSYYSLHPLRSMNGKKLDCLVWHPTFSGPRRIPYNLVVHCEYLLFWVIQRQGNVLKKNIYICQVLN